MQNGKTSGSQEIPHSSNQFGFDPGMGELHFVFCYPYSVEKRYKWRVLIDLNPGGMYTRKMYIPTRTGPRNPYPHWHN